MFRLSAALCLGLILCSAAHGAMEWPQELSSSEGIVVIYQPQPEKLEGNVLTARAAMSIESPVGSELIFGALWFNAKIDTDRDNGIALIRDLTITNVRWPNATDANQQRFTSFVEAAIPNTGFEISLERLTESLEAAAITQQSLAGLKNDPPVIVFRDELAVLLSYDGAPRFSAIENSDYERVLNTPFAVVRHKNSGTLYLSSDPFWYTASDPLGPWTHTTSPPQDLVAMIPKPESNEGAPASPPAIVAASEPTELISTQGEPEWTSLAGGQLLYVKNTESPWLRELETGNMYLLLSGRWFRSKSQDGPWTFVRPDELPASFKDIPPASDIGGLRVSVAGTEEANDAVLDARIPQTAAINRSEAKLDVEYDGSPNFEKIPGTSVSYAVNTGAQVLAVAGSYYAVDNGVWFTSASANGPWVVADSVPEDEIAKIPPSSPVYNTTHVHVYQSTPQVVYVGYTPGYMWSYPYYGVPVYGTGWYYPPYWGGPYYYPRAPTWGISVGYNPWTGWSVGIGWSNGFFSVGVRFGGGYYGPYRPGRCCYGGGYRRPININTGDINIGNSINIGDRTNIRNQIDRDTRINNSRDRSNLYNRAENQGRLANRDTAQANRPQARPATGRANNVYADRNGNISRRTNYQWQSRENGRWQSSDRTRPATQNRPTPQQRPQQTRPTTTRTPSYNRSSLDRSASARQRGASRERSRPTTMSRGGGGRRR